MTAGRASPAQGHEKAAAVSVEGAQVRYDDVVAVDGASLTLAPGEVHVLLGPSGCGKTTLLRVVAGLERLHAGIIRLGGRVVEHAERPQAWVPPEARRVGLVFQDYALFPHLTIAENVAFGRRASKRMVDEHLERVGLEALAHRLPAELSGGQQQRVALARALATEPDVLLLDEPFSGVDERLRRDLRKRTAALLREAGVAVLFVTHDVDEAFTLGDVLSVMAEGRILQTDAPETLYRCPASATAALTVGEAALLPASRSPGADEATCALGPVPIRTASDGASHRARGHVVIRPEQVRLARPGDDEAPTHAVPVTVTERTFLGGIIEMGVLLQDGTTLTARHPAGPGPEPSGHDLVAWLEGATAWV